MSKVACVKGDYIYREMIISVLDERDLNAVLWRVTFIKEMFNLTPS